MRKLGFRFLLLTALLLALAGCAIRGTSYLALSYTGFQPDRIYFPQLPVNLLYDTYYEHPAGTYYADYEVDNGAFVELWEFYYTIKENPGEGFIFGVPGKDRYYTMYLDAGGPWVEYFNASASLSGGKTAKQKSSTVNEPGDRSKFDLSNPTPFSTEKVFDGYIFRIEGRKYLRNK